MRGKKTRKNSILNNCNMMSNSERGEYLPSLPIKGRLAEKNVPEMGKIIPK
jgi:hypothetical protein